MRFVFMILVLMLSVQAFAQETPMNALCRILETHQPRNDVKYIASVDVSGNPIVPADLQPPEAKYDVVEIPVEVNLMQRFGLTVNGGIKMTPEVMNVQVHKDGRVLFDDQDISEQAYNSCGMSRKVDNIPPPEASGAPTPINKVQDDVIEGQAGE